MKICVGKSAIERAQPYATDRCPIAIAFREQAGIPESQYVEVDEGTIRLYGADDDIESYIPLPEEAVAFYQAYDDWDSNDPPFDGGIEFEIEFEREDRRSDCSRASYIRSTCKKSKVAPTCRPTRSTCLTRCDP